jgi:hypothetical protein
MDPQKHKPYNYFTILLSKYSIQINNKQGAYYLVIKDLILKYSNIYSFLPKTSLKFCIKL